MSDITEFVRVWEEKEKKARHSAEYWKAEHLAGNVRITELEAALAAERERAEQLHDEKVGLAEALEDARDSENEWQRKFFAEQAECLEFVKTAKELDDALEAERAAHQATKHLYQTVCDRLELVRAAIRGEATINA